MSKVPGEAEQFDNVCNFLIFGGNLCRVCLQWSQHASKDFVSCSDSFEEIIANPGVPSSDICHDCHLVFSQFKELRDLSRKSVEIFSILKETLQFLRPGTDKAEEPKREISERLKKKTGRPRNETQDHRGVRQRVCCDLCGYVCFYKSQLTSHMKANHVTPSVNCCDKLWTPLKYRTHHRNVHLSPSLHRRGPKVSIEIPEVAETTHKEFSCPECHSEFDKLSFLKRHFSRKHSYRSPRYPCGVCRRPFLTKHELGSHIKEVHLRNEVRSCPLCGKSYHSRNHMRKHLLTHTDLHFKCQCGVKIKELSSFRRHLKLRHELSLSKDAVNSFKVLDEVGMAEKMDIFKRMYES